MPPYAEDAPLGEDAPPCSEDTPPCPEDTPQGNDAPLQEHSPPTISGPLRADLCRVWALGFLDCMKGEEVNDDDEIPSDMAELLVKLSESSINGAEDFIAQVFTENPKMVYSTVYFAGFEVCAAMNAAYGPTEINLN